MDNRVTHADQTRFEPIRLVEIELARPLPQLTTDDGRGSSYQTLIVRLHGQPLGYLPLKLADSSLSSGELAALIWEKFGEQINAHLIADGISPITAVGTEGVPGTDPPRCLQALDGVRAAGPLASIVVATRDRPELLRSCLESLLALNYPNFEVIVVDNAPTTDATREFVAEMVARAPHIRYVLEARKGLSFARNRGAAEAQGEIVVFLDDDATVDPSWLAQLVAAFDRSPNVQCVTGLVIPAEMETEAQVLFEAFAGYGKGFQPLLFDLGENRPRVPTFPFSTGKFGTGANMAFRASVLGQIGGFDPALGAGSLSLGGEELSAFFNVIVRGHTVAYEPRAIAYHRHRREYENLHKQVYAFGVGFTAYVTQIMIDHPRWLPALLWRLPAGLYYLLSPMSDKNKKQPRTFPLELKLIELKGMVYGPIAYARSRRALRGADRGWRPAQLRPSIGDTALPVSVAENA